MPPAARSIRQEQRELGAKLRDQGKTWSQVAAAFCGRYDVNMRAALRMARDWSQRDAADEWNRRWPAELKTYKNFYLWERWPRPKGPAPSLDVLARLAELYECRIADLVADCADFRPSDPVYNQGHQLARLPELMKLDHGAAALKVHDLIARLELMDVHELARQTSAWSRHLGTEANRRSILIKLSAGLSLAAALSASAYEAEATSTPPALAPSDDFSGIWHSHYVYPSSGRGKDFVGEHYVVFRQQANRLIGQSLPHKTGSQLRIELAVDRPVATGSWRETTSPVGYYKGATYHGTLQLVLDPSGNRMRGMWLGFGREFTINSGEWHLTLETRSVTKPDLREYTDKL